MGKYPKWTPREDKELIKAIKRSPENLNNAFKKVSAKTGRSVSSCSQRWYSTVSKQYSSDVNAACFAIYSQNKFSVNRKTPKEDIPVEKRRSWWQRICDFISSL